MANTQMSTAQHTHHITGTICCVLVLCFQPLLLCKQQR
jgi:hypothetical protein